MAPVLRKRKAPEVAPPPPPPAKKATKARAKAAPASKDVAVEKKPAAAEKPAKKTAAPTAGDVIALDGFGGEVETNDGEKVTLKGLVDESKGGVVLFTYPRASTPGCTKQVCFFRDDYEDLTRTGFAIYGLSTDSGKANTTFRNKHDLPYPLLCDPDATLIGAIGLKKAPKGTQRGVFVVAKDGKVIAAAPGGPLATVELVKALVEEAGEEEEEEVNGEANGKGEDEEKKDADEKEAE